MKKRQFALSSPRKSIHVRYDPSAFIDAIRYKLACRFGLIIFPNPRSPRGSRTYRLDRIRRILSDTVSGRSRDTGREKRYTITADNSRVHSRASRLRYRAKDPRQ